MLAVASAAVLGPKWALRQHQDWLAEHDRSNSRAANISLLRQAATLSTGSLRGLDVIGGEIRDLMLKDVDLRGLHAFGTRFVNVAFDGVDLQRADISYAAVTGAITRCDLRAAFGSMSTWTGCDLTGSRFEGAQLWAARFDECKFRNASLAGAQLASAYLRYCDFTGCDLSGAFLGRPTDGAHSSDVFEVLSASRHGVPRDANAPAEVDVWFGDTPAHGTLRRALARPADLRSANLSKSRVEGADFSFVSYDELTRWPVGYRPDHPSVPAVD